MPNVAPTNERPNSPGVLISFEGLDGVGKTTQIGLVENALRAQGRETLRLREPGATRLGEAVRELLLDKQDLDISRMAELLLFEAARAQLVESVIQPALERGCVVLCDRFYDSTVAYQGHGRRLGTDLVHKANVLACGALEPDRTLVLDMDLARAHTRACAQGADRMEREPDDFHKRVRQGFLQLAGDEAQRVHIVDASGSVQQVWGRVRDALGGLLNLPVELPSDIEEPR